MVGTWFWAELPGREREGLRSEDTLYQCVGKHVSELVLLDKFT
jgi:hypothetical protein